jgi:hypothetical protein
MELTAQAMLMLYLPISGRQLSVGSQLVNSDKYAPILWPHSPRHVLSSAALTLG